MIRGILSESLGRRGGWLFIRVHAGLQTPLPRTQGSLTCCSHEWHAGNTASHRFLFSNFRYSFTLFSKFFASFPHGTCSLSVSHQYLALDGIYHPLELQSQTTRLVESLKVSSASLGQARTGLSPSLALRSRRLCPPYALALSSFSRRHFRRLYV